MACCDLAQFFSLTKWLTFIICAVGFIWKDIDSYTSYLAQEVGTKTDLKANHEIGSFPGLAVCRHPNQVFNLVNPDTNQSLDNYNLTLAHLRFLTAYRVKPSQGLEPFFDKYLFNDSSIVRGVTVAKRGSYARVSHEADFVSRPSRDRDDWTTFFHPIYGTCIDFAPSADRDPEEFVGSAGIQYLKVSVDFHKAFPSLKDVEGDSDQKISSQTQKDWQNKYGENSLLVVVYDRGSFFTTQQVVLLNNRQNEMLTLHQEIMDKNGIQSKIACDKYENEFTEDQCLIECLAQTYFDEFGCLHSRLKRMNIANDTLKKSRICVLDDFEIDVGSTKKVSEEPGLVRIREILASFFDDDSELRCGCKVKCRKNVITTTRLPSATSDEKNSKRSHIRFAYFEFQPFVKIYTYHMLYTGSDLVADIGGYLGLFLGISIFGLVEALEKVFSKAPLSPTLEKSDTILRKRGEEEIIEVE